jgi:hypothetical protein
MLFSDRAGLGCFRTFRLTRVTIRLKISPVLTFDGLPRAHWANQASHPTATCQPPAAAAVRVRPCEILTCGTPARTDAADPIPAPRAAMRLHARHPPATTPHAVPLLSYASGFAAPPARAVRALFPSAAANSYRRPWAARRDQQRQTSATTIETAYVMISSRF